MLFQIERDYPRTDVGAADVDCQDRIVGFEYPWRCQMHGADQAGFVGIATDRNEVNRHLVGFQNHGGAADGELAHPAGAKAAAYDDPFGIAPRLELEETADDERKLLCEILDCPLDDTGRLRIAFGEQGVELLPADLIARLVAERVIAGFSQGFAPFLNVLAECTLGGAVAEETFVVLQLNVIAVDVDQRQPTGAMGRDGRQGRSVLGHQPVFP